MTEFEVDVLGKLGAIGERLARLEERMLGLPCVTDCPKNGNSTKRYLYLGLGIGAGITGAGSAGVAIAKALGL